MNGKVVIGCELTTEQFDKQISSVEKRLKELDEKANKPIEVNGVKITGATNLTKEEENEYNQLQSKLNELYNQKLELDKAEQSITQELKKQEAVIEQQNNATKEQILNNSSNASKILELSSDLEKMVHEYNAIQKADIISTKDINRAKELKKDIRKAVKEIEKLGGGKITIRGIDDVSKKTNNINNGLNNIIKKVGKWALAVFGVRSAYSAIRSAMSTLTQYDDQLATNLEYIRYALASTLKPVIEWILNAVVKLLQYINYIWKAWTKNDLFKPAEAFEKAKKNAQGLNKELNKTTTSFDEMQTLSAPSSTSGGGANTSGFNLTAPPEGEIPKWVEAIKNFGVWVINNWPIVLGLLGAIGGALIIGKIVKFIKSLKEAKDTTKGVGNTFKGFFDGLGRAASAIAILGGMALVIKELTNLIDAFADSGLSLGQVAGLLGIALGSVAIAFTAMAAATKLMDWTGIAGAVVILGGMALVLNQITKLIDTFANSGLELTDVIGLMATVVGSLIVLMASIVLLGPAMTAGLVPFSILVAEISAVLLVMMATLPIILDAVGKFIQQVAPSLCIMLRTIGDLIIKIILALGVTLPPIVESIGNLFGKVFNGISQVVNSVGIVMLSIMRETGRLVDSILSSLLRFIRELGPAINSFVDGAIQAVTKLINFVVSGIEYLINTVIVNPINSLIGTINKISGVKVGLLSPANIPRFRPRLARGAILNQPGKGIPVGNAIAGEAGREAYIPLQDPQALAMVGEAIGKYVTLSATIPIYVGNRQIAREIRQINADNDFAYNR
nr:MAG TPA: helix-rich protein [Caudoviricetes sp.]